MANFTYLSFYLTINRKVQKILKNALQKGECGHTESCFFFSFY